MTWYAVSSASGWVKACAWEAGELHVRFKGRVCIYSDPDATLFEGLVAADSAGGYVHQFLYTLPYR